MSYPTYTAGAFPGTAGATGGDYRNLFKKAYVDMIRTKVQVENSVLQDTCDREMLEGDPLYLDSYKTVTLTTRAINQQYGAYTTGGDKLYKSTLTERRLVRPSFYEFAELFDPRHEKAWLRAVRPDSQYARNVMAAFNRQKDSTIVTAFDAAVTLDGEHVTGSTGIVTGSAGNTIWYSDPRVDGALGGNTTGLLDLQRIIVAARLLNSAGAQGRRYAAIHPVGLEQLLTDTNITSADYNAIKLLMSGEINTFMGFEWRICPQIGTSTVKATSGATTSGQTTGYGAYFYTENAMVFGMTNDVRVRFDEIPDRGYALQVYHEFGLGAVRMDESAIVRVQHID